MIIRALDADHDFKFGKGRQDYLTQNMAVAENIQTRLLCFKDDCYFDKAAGIEWFRLLGTKKTLAEIILTCRSVILASYGAVRVNRIAPVVLPDRSLRVEYNMDSIFSLRYTQTFEVSNV